MGSHPSRPGHLTFRNLQHRLHGFVTGSQPTTLITISALDFLYWAHDDSDALKNHHLDRTTTAPIATSAPGTPAPQAFNPPNPHLSPSSDPPDTAPPPPIRTPNPPPGLSTFPSTHRHHPHLTSLNHHHSYLRPLKTHSPLSIHQSATRAEVVKYRDLRDALCLHRICWRCWG